MSRKPKKSGTGRAINDSMPRYVATMAVKGLNKVGKTTKGSSVLVMGLTYKEDVSDTRESPFENRYAI